MEWMKDSIESFIENVIEKDTSDIILVSGGSAWSDHTVVQLFNENNYAGLNLYLPALFDCKTSMFVNTRDGYRLNQLHGDYEEITGINSLSEFKKAIQKKQTETVSYSSFMIRNNAIASNCDYMLAFGFDDKPQGGTLYTWNKCKNDKTFIQI